MTNVVIPIAGAGSRYAQAGYELPKPLVDIKGVPATQRVVWGSGVGGKLIYIVQADHNKKYGLSELLPTFSPELETLVLEVDQVTEGPAASVLVAKDYINNDDLLVIYDSQGIIWWEPNNFLIDAGEGRSLDGSIATFSSSENKGWFANTDEKTLVTEVVESNSESDQGCAGVYYWRSGSDFVAYAEAMILENDKTNGEFQIAPVYNRAINDGKTVGVYPVTRFIPLGDPKDLESNLDSIVDDPE